MTAYKTSSVSFESEHIRCAGVLYRPASAPAEVPCVVLAHGFSGTMDCIVPDFARRFAAGGLAASSSTTDIWEPARVGRDS